MEIHSYNDLPLEVIVNIYKYLDVTDIKAAQLTCHQWLNASGFREVQDRIFLILTCRSIQDKLTLDLFKNSFRTFPNVIFKKRDDDIYEILSVDRLIEFFSIKNLTENMRYLILEEICTEITVDELGKILQSLLKLEKFVLIDEYSDFFPIEKVANISYQLPQNLRSILLSANFFKNEAGTLLAQIRNLEEMQVIKKSMNYSLCYVANMLFEILKNNENSLKKLKLENEVVIQVFGLQERMTKLKLTELSLAFDVNFHNKTQQRLKDFIATQHLLTNLSIVNSRGPGLNDTEITEIIRNLPFLEKLNLEGNLEITDKTLIEISKLKQLKCLNINDLDIGDDGIINGLAKTTNFNIIELKCMGIELSDDALKVLTENLPNLQILHYGLMGLRHNAGKYIFKNCKNLAHLTFNAIDTSHRTNLLEHQNLSTVHILYCGELRFLWILVMKNLKELRLESRVADADFDDEERIGLFTTFLQNCSSIKKLSFHFGVWRGIICFESFLKIIMNNLKQLQELQLSFGCRYSWRQQHMFLMKNREDLSITRIDCSCESCIEVYKLCKTFIEKK